MSVVGVPKTIDNDIKLIDRSFGFDTAVQVLNSSSSDSRQQIKYLRAAVSLLPFLFSFFFFCS